MISSHRTSEADLRRDDRRVEQPVVAVLLVCLLLFVDVPLPLFENSSRLLALLIFPFLLFGGGRVPTPFCAVMYVLFPIYILVPIISSPDVGAFAVGKVLIVQLLYLGGMVLLARAVASDSQRRKLTDLIVLFALASSVLAILQRFGILGPLGRDRWGYSTTTAGDLRGAGFLSDPNFLAVLLASVVPLIVSWRFTWLRAPALVILAMGLYSTNSRAGILLAVIALVFSLASWMSTTNAAFLARGRKSVTLVTIVLVVLFAFNVGGQRDRSLRAFFIEAGIQSNFGRVDAADIFVADERKQLLASWINLGMNNLPFGIGMGTKNELANAAHNTYATLFAEGGMIGLAIILLILMCFAFFLRRGLEPFAIMGAVIVLGGIVLSYSGMVFLVLPMGLADGILAARLGIRSRPGSESAPTQAKRGGPETTEQTQAPETAVTRAISRHGQ
jgi:hypothetical protein